ncbi:hypothetical protein ElyMa_003543600 [Elysia marginata]|uniref:Uncharacterized protein n=1 Tax=Elysia marginata TaxID=1093978 RepID=A0AAV4EJX8_9GAST|nr:hypothetical protein ElyMa_003543600 [Elysia marginata]
MVDATAIKRNTPLPYRATRKKPAHIVDRLAMVSVLQPEPAGLTAQPDGSQMQPSLRICLLQQRQTIEGPATVCKL